MRFLLGCFFLLVAIGIYAQTPAHYKYSASLKMFLADEHRDQRFLSQKNGQTYVAVFLKIQPGRSSETNATDNGIQFRTIAGDIATADIPLNSIESIAKLPWVQRIELPVLLRHTDTVMKRLTNADRVLRGDQPLNRKYKGEGVVIGVIDDGIDITHPEFMDSTGRSRVKSMWSMDYQNGAPPPGFNYGNFWKADSIEANITKIRNNELSRFDFERKFGYAFHGTSVTGLAAGNEGIAPKADIVMVSLTAFADTLLRSDRIVDAIAFIHGQARSMKKKCVINISLGTAWGGPHDGRSMVEQAIDNYCVEVSDLFIAVSAGNNGNDWKHWAAMPVNKDSSFGFFRCSYKSSMYFSIPKRYTDSLKISVTDSKLGNLNSPWISRDSIFYQSPFVLIRDVMQQPSGITFTSYLKTGVLSSKITLTAASANDDYDELILTTEEFTSNANAANPFDDHLYRFIFKGNGSVHGWYPFWNLHPIYYFGNNPYPNDPTYINSDNAFSTGIPSNAFRVFSTGAFNARYCYLSTLHNKGVYSYPKCQLTYFTSRGPTLDGRIKPDIIAPGENVIAPRYTLDTYLGHEMITDIQHLAFSGTSASSPITAGIAALLWEQRPDYTRDSIINRLKKTAYGDSYTAVTGALPNNISGWGKIDAFKAMTGDSTDMQSSCRQWENCAVINTNPPVIPPVPANDPSISFAQISPNPASYYFNVIYRSSETLQLAIFNTSGQLIETQQLPPSATPVIKPVYLKYNAAGLYFVRIMGNKLKFTHKLIVQHN